MTKNEEYPKLIPTISKDFFLFVKHLFSGEFFRTVKNDFGELREFYIDQHHKRRLDRMSRFRSWFVIPFWLFKNLILRLSTFRRILFIFALFFLLSSQTANGDSINRIFLGVILFIFLLLLELKDKLLARQELEAGRAIQMALQPEDCPEIPGWDVWLYSKPANDVGGDLVDYIKISDSKHGIIIGDVAGKGLGAALFMSKLQSTLRALVFDSESLVSLADKMNRIFYRDTLPNSFTSMIYLEISPKSSTVNFVNAGHIPPLHIQKDNIKTIPKGAQALGIMPDVKYEGQNIELKKDDYLLIYSDGLSEARNKEGRFLGEDKVLEYCSKFGNSSAKTAGSKILDDVTMFTQDASQADDLSMVIIRRSG